MGEANKLEKKILTGSTLKWIAILTMLLDHIGAFLIEPFLLEHGIGLGPIFGGVQGLETHPYYFLSQIYTILRLIGRLAFPIFAFLIVEGFLHTRNLKKYIFQMGIFALVSEIPFDLAGSGVVIESFHQNIFFTLFIGLLSISMFDRIDTKSKIRWLVPILGMVFAELLRTDYSAMGVLVIFIFYYFHDDFKIRNLFNGILFLSQLTAVFSLILIQLYNGKRGKQNKFFFYIFYPAHLILLFLIREFILVDILF